MKALILAPVVEVSGLGADLCAAVGAGVYSSLNGRTHREHIAEYEELYRKWLTTSR